MNNRELKRKAAEDHNKQYYAEKDRLSKMSDDDILQEKIALSVSKATSELMPQANKMLTGE